MRLRGREPLWSLTRHFINMSLHSGIGEAGGCRGAPAPTGALADQLFLHSWEGGWPPCTGDPWVSRWGRERWWQHRSLRNPSGRAEPPSERTLPRLQDGWGPIPATLWRALEWLGFYTNVSGNLHNVLWRRWMCTLPWPLASILPCFLPEIRAVCWQPAKEASLNHKLPCSCRRPHHITLTGEQ